MPLDPLITGPNTVVIEYEENELSDLILGPGDWLPDFLEVTIIYKGTVDGTNVGRLKMSSHAYIDMFLRTFMQTLIIIKVSLK